MLYGNFILSGWKENSMGGVADPNMKVLERYVVLLYSRTLQLTEVNEARQQVFSHDNRKLENISPSHAALCQHVNRVAYQAGHIYMERGFKKQSFSSMSLGVGMETR